MKALVTGGAGFIGSHLVDALLEQGADVVVLDCLEPQVHGQPPHPPDYLNWRAKLVIGSMLDAKLVGELVNEADVVFHEAALVGVGQSMYEIAHYCETNMQGTAVLLEAITKRPRRLDRLIVASSGSVLGEGRYRCGRCGEFAAKGRLEADLCQQVFEIRCPTCGQSAEPLPLREDMPPEPTSVYAISKKTQEELCLCVGRAYQIPTVVLRYFNVYGPRQSPSNPYTGVISTFIGRVLNGSPPLVFEDGKQTRDFVHVHDIVQANLLALKAQVPTAVYNVGTGRATSVLELARTICQLLGSDVEVQILGKYRNGDVRHSRADISKARAELGYEPKVSLEAGLKEVIEWVKEQPSPDMLDMVEASEQKLC